MASSSGIATGNAGFQALIWDIVRFCALGDEAKFTIFIGRNSGFKGDLYCG